jgi:hypothetical protein
MRFLSSALSSPLSRRRDQTHRPSGQDHEEEHPREHLLEQQQDQGGASSLMVRCNPLG